MGTETTIRTRENSRPDIARKRPERARRDVLACAPLEQHLTLLELVEAVGTVTDDDAEVVATVAHMLRSGTVKLCGSFRDLSPIDWTTQRR
jgi:hypothetical protein